MKGYNAPKDEGYNVKDNYGNNNQSSVMQSSNYQTQGSVIPMYKVKEEQPQQKKKSRCPRGALYGEIGSCCGMQCTRACALEG